MAQHQFKTPQSRRGFSLLEILIVVGVIALLTTLAVVGFKIVGGTARNRVTVTALENCKSFQSNYEVASGDISGLFDGGLVTSLTTKPNTTNPRWRIGTTAGAATVTNCFATTPNTIYAIGSTNGDAETSMTQRDINDRLLRDETARVLRRLASVPATRQALEAMPADRIVKLRFPVDPAAVPSAMTAMNAEYSLSGTPELAEGLNLIDGDGHPIYFIPGGGLANVNVGYQGKGDKADKANYDRPTQLIRAPDHKPFWASPGPDGNLTTGDDNVYSFEH